MWFGESQKNVRKIFDRYKEIAKGVRRPPVLLLNEADQFLHKRMNASWSTDHTEMRCRISFLNN